MSDNKYIYYFKTRKTTIKSVLKGLNELQSLNRHCDFTLYYHSKYKMSVISELNKPMNVFVVFNRYGSLIKNEN